MLWIPPADRKKAEIIGVILMATESIFDHFIPTTVESPVNHAFNRGNKTINEYGC